MSTDQERLSSHFSNIQMFFRDRWLRTSEENSSWNWNIGGYLILWPFESDWGVPTGLQHFRQFRTYLSEAMPVCLWISPYVIAYHICVMKAKKNTRSPHYFRHNIRYKTLNFCFKWEWYDERSSGSFGLMRAFHAWMVVRGFSTTTIRVTTNTWKSHICVQSSSYVPIMNNRTASFLFLN